MRLMLIFADCDANMFLWNTEYKQCLRVSFIDAKKQTTKTWRNEEIK